MRCSRESRMRSRSGRSVGVLTRTVIAKICKERLCLARLTLPAKNVRRVYAAKAGRDTPVHGLPMPAAKTRHGQSTEFFRECDALVAGRRHLSDLSSQFPGFQW